MPSDSLARFNEVMKETQAYGFDKIRGEQQALGDRVRAMLTGKGIKSVAAAGFQAPGVVVSYADDADFQTFRIGLFGLEKLHNIERTVSPLEQTLDEVMVN
jgi:aspartate aminotransferase-like enzyme